MPEARTDWSATIRLPKTDFPMKGDLAVREPERLAAWEKAGLYSKLRARQKGRPEFLFHDGPPYANGHIHIGHAQNKILKDMAVKTRALMGFSTPFIPGWDCHGLPIETALLKEMKMSKRGVTDIPKFRKDAAAFAERFIDIQRAEFKRLGVFADWDNPYKTLTKRYEAAILRSFADLLAKDHVYRGLKPVLWCPTCETALADAEVEYKDKTSPSVYVALPIVRADDPALKGASLIIWTTTPWTLPANRAIAAHPKLDYALVESEGRKYVVGKARLEAVLPGAKLVKEYRGDNLHGILYTPPYPKKDGETCRVVLAEYVTADDGTGLVHTAPGHGEDDFATGMREKLEIYNPVGGNGAYDDTVPELLRGKSILKDANPAVLEDLKARGLLLVKKDIQHSYPHCWRCKNPVVFRTTEQWFLRLNEELRGALVREIDATKWIPAEGKNRIGSMVQNRPDWCLSRQRVWGTPIPVLYSAKTGAVVRDAKVMEAILAKAEADGIDFWFEKFGQPLSPSDWPWLPKHPDLADGFKRETDILDVWLDSGVSWRGVLGEDAVADLYLEGSDQHRGWFQSSLVMSTALRGKAPYKAVLTHGFVLDEKGHAMHKSAGNVVAPQEVIAKWGADVLRLWVALADVHEDTRISEKLLAGPGEAYRRVRNTLKYLLGNLSGFDASKAVPYEKLPEMERFFLHRLAALQKDVLADYEAHHYRGAARRLVDFCSFDLSAVYLDCTKDRMYTFKEDSPERRAAQTVMAETFSRLCALLAPVLSFTAEEAWTYWEAKPSESVFLSDLPPVGAKWTDAALASKWDKALELRERVLKKIEEARAQKLVGKSLQAKVVLPGDRAPYEGIDLEELFIVSRVEWGAGSEPTVLVAEGAKCPRCWRVQPDIGAEKGYPELCGRCARQL